MAIDGDRLRRGARRLFNVTTVSGVVGVLAAGTVISSATGLLPQAPAVQAVGLGALASTALWFSAAGGEGWSDINRRAARGFAGAVGLISAVGFFSSLLDIVRSRKLLAEDVLPEGDGRVIGAHTAERDYEPTGARAEAFSAEVYPVDFSQYHPLDSHHQDLAGQPPIWLAEAVPEVSAPTATAHAGNVVVSGVVAAKSEDVLRTWVMPSHTANSAGSTGHGVPQWFGAEAGIIGNHVHNAEGNGHVLGQ